MQKKLIGFTLVYFALNLVCFSQVDTTYIYDTNTPYGGLDIRVAKSATDYYYLQEDKTFSFREISPGVKTDTYRDMTAWDSSPYKQGNLREKTNNGDNFIMNYRMLAPQGYNPSYQPGYPLVIVFHGYGERGNCEDNVCYHADPTYLPQTNSPPAPTDADHELLNNDHNLLNGGKEHLAAVNLAGTKLPNDPGLSARAFPGFVIFPQNLNGWDQSSVQDAIRILRLIIKRYNIDEDRVYVEGISNGGHGLYEALKRAPWLFAAAIPLSAIDDGFINAEGVAPSIAHIPLWIFQGGYDIHPYPSKTLRYIQQFRNAGASIRYTLYPELGHGTWNRAFGEPDYFSWLLGTNKSDIHSFENSTAICSEEGNKLELAQGFPAYQWEFNGQIISGATSATFSAKNPGKYRARFSRVSSPTEAQWNQWSKALTLTVESAPVANIRQVGTVVLKDLNGLNEARLESDTTHAHYYWYKNSTLVDLPGSEDDTLRMATLAASYGNGAYTLVVSDFGCNSTPSEPKYVFFSNQAPLNIAVPTGFQGSSSSASEVNLGWNKVTGDNVRYEIWRRRKINDTSFSPWEMATITSANVSAFTDTGLIPLSAYQYKLRAVSNTGRSDYTPAGTEGLAVQTVVDDQSPSAPTELQVRATAIQTLSLSWRASSDNSRVREYRIYFNDDSMSTSSPDTTFLLENLPLNRNYEIFIKAVDLSGNLSEASTKVQGTTYLSGLFYQHSTGTWRDLDSISWLRPEFTGKVKDFSLAKKTQDDYFNFSFEGLLLIENSGSYEFRTTSDDGSRLILNQHMLVNNDGVHELKTVASASTSLNEGPQRIRVEFFDYIESDSLLVEYKGPDTGNNWAIISRDVLKSDKSVVTAVGPDNGPEDSFSVSVFPNPTSQDNIHIQIQTVFHTPVRVRLVDPVGRSLFEGVFQPEEVSEGISMSIPGAVSTGIYIVMVDQGTTRVRQKVLIRK